MKNIDTSYQSYQAYVASMQGAGNDLKEQYEIGDDEFYSDILSYEAWVIEMKNLDEDREISLEDLGYKKK
ncbi:hypothetical protein LP109_14550 (plasmid) [Moraxella bovis]|uniref:Uncharacterized protein n=1 Tax=Moraxella bovis TaxID=476 RepID=A0ABY6MEY0_MORBO|nr:hypothetical protein [Moraxella bovis]UYZ79777.1 hypothetical protein LP115_14205 [Moraxella bovis]UYZ88261.1 hypothetical protein LP094_14230 [Moraxella bovis]UYZ90993.1 hypothetical protein LP114_14300 [Moraxella bovis]UYZ99236.1 hypothetical protein LP107_14110 [Moraxella bovis]UZA01900.1 hypothetical protein LP086_14010 [Moraxella bovis]